MDIIGYLFGRSKFYGYLSSIAHWLPSPASCLENICKLGDLTLLRVAPCKAMLGDSEAGFDWTVRRLHSEVLVCRISTTLTTALDVSRGS